MPTDRLQVRAALALHTIYLARAAQTVEETFLAVMEGFQEAVERVRTSLREVSSTGCPPNRLSVRRHLRNLVRIVQNAETEFGSIQPPSGLTIPDPRFLLEELRQLEDEFSGLQLDLKKKILSVTTDPIELKGVYLGPFKIQLAWSRLNGETSSACFEIVALQPSPAASNDEVTHPHVRGGVLCAGDAKIPIQRALTQGRMADAFCLIRSVLTTYNPSSPHVSLDDWEGEEGEECYDCGCNTHADDLYYCALCGYDYCVDCIEHCHDCHESRCSDCLTSCHVCDQSFCPSCLCQSAHSEKRCCRNCLQPCTVCSAKVALDELDPETRYCPACRFKGTEPAPSPSDAALEPNLEPSQSESNHELSLPDAAVT